MNRCSRFAEGVLGTRDLHCRGGKLDPGTLSAAVSADLSSAAAPGSLDLDLVQPSYFADLTRDHGRQLAQFGVYA